MNDTSSPESLTVAAGTADTPPSGCENIHVYLRMRPLNQREIAEEHAVSAWKILDRQSITLD
jgi:hypothetical protein